jgi:hypothetical protein
LEVHHAAGNFKVLREEQSRAQPEENGRFHR